VETGATGTTFEVRLPGAPAVAAAQRKPRAAEPKGV
jgi:hypothetical protein